MSLNRTSINQWPEPRVSPRIPLSIPALSHHEKQNLDHAYKSTQISGTGLYVERSENLLSEILNTNALVVSNGSVALTLALKALGVDIGDEVIVPSLTYAATASSVVNIGAIPIFVDVNLESWNIAADEIAKFITPRTKAILVVDLYGNPAEMRQIQTLAKRHNIPLIQDSAEAFGARYLGHELGNFADVSTYSFFANKIITCGEGGAVTTNNPSLLEKMRLLRGQGMSPDIRYFFEVPGYNFRLSNLSAAILTAQLERATELIEKRMEVYELYRRHLRIDYTEPISPGESIQSPWLFTIRLPKISMKNKLEIASKLATRGIQTRPVFYPLPSMPAFFIEKSEGSNKIQNSELISNEGMSLPTFPGLQKNQVLEICEIVNSQINV